nr:hypothetical protein [Salinivibrio socompensis]
MARWLFAITLAVCCLPLLPGLGGLLASAFAYLPALGLAEVSLSGWREVISWPGLSQSLWLTLVSGLASSLLAVVLSFAILSGHLANALLAANRTQPTRFACPPSRRLCDRAGVVIVSLRMAIPRT